MWLVSSRYTLDSDTKPAAKAAVYEAPDSRAQSSRIRVASWEEMLASVANQRVLVLVHGYDNAIGDVTASYAIVRDYVTRMVRGQYDQVVGYTWPSARNKARWWLARRNADKVDGAFYDMLRRMKGAGACLDVMTHSLGAHVALSGLKQYGKQGVVRNLYLTAAAVDNESVQQREMYYRATTYCERVFNFHSRADEVLHIAYALAEADAALGWLGPESPERVGANFFMINCLRVVSGHSKYKNCSPVYAYIANALKTPAKVAKMTTL